MTEEERRELAVQVATAFILHKLLKSEGNAAAELLLDDAETAAFAETFRELNKWWTSRPPLPLESFAWFQGGLARKAKLLAPLV